MNATRASVDLDDASGLIAADRDGLLRAASMAGAQVRATAAAVEEGVLDPLRGERPRSLIWVSGRGTAESAGVMLAAVLAGVTAEPIVPVYEVPPWIGPLDVLVVAGDDPADPVLVAAAATGVRRGARVVVVAPAEGPLRDASAGRAVALSPRVWVPDEFGLCRYLAAGLAIAQAVDPAVHVDLAALADDLDAEALRNSAAREIVTNAAKSLADRIGGRGTAFVGDSPATLALARHAASFFLRVTGEPVASGGLADGLVALRSAAATGGGADPVDALFHDEELDGPLPARLRIVALTLGAERSAVVARVAGFDDVDVVGAQDVPDLAGDPTALAHGRPEQQLATLAVRLEMAAVYLRLAGG
ncbi:TobH protein [Mycolicibacterium confluentis]|uniref:TobH protein n=1 Tax=Mycolicibacterium confluentis TaxID=28047 RepID=A0A7I7XZT8_9MYCO|nr:TobH protein [Mycolicibacterium confluentis]MCV7319816.1 TobH protein [Mycolicibacterium confluentis]ORV34397.1 TobH protein [Mycolicibacterium confluentis]BBZ34846.1 TobH protein [Mycolicibacterium confluentis]